MSRVTGWIVFPQLDLLGRVGAVTGLSPARHHGRSNHVTSQFHRVSRRALPDQQKQHPSCQSGPTSAESTPSSFLSPVHLSPSSWHMALADETNTAPCISEAGLRGQAGMMLPPTHLSAQTVHHAGAQTAEGSVWWEEDPTVCKRAQLKPYQHL